MAGSLDWLEQRLSLSHGWLGGGGCDRDLDWRRLGICRARRLSYRRRWCSLMSWCLEDQIRVIVLTSVWDVSVIIVIKSVVWCSHLPLSNDRFTHEIPERLLPSLRGASVSVLLLVGEVIIPVSALVDVRDVLFFINSVIIIIVIILFGNLIVWFVHIFVNFPQVFLVLFLLFVKLVRKVGVWKP